MAYEISCPNGHKLQVKPEHFGLQVRCPICKTTLVVPDLSASPQTSESPPSEPPEQPPASPPRVSERPVSQKGTRSMPEFNVKMIGYVGLVLGLIVVVGAKGCDNLGARDIHRSQAKVQQAQSEFTREWNDRIENAKDADKTKLAADMDKAKKDLAKGEWKKLEYAAEDASRSNSLAGYWRELAFVIGSVILTLGLLIVGITGQGAERTIAYIIIAIIAFSLYIGGVAWIASIANLFGR